MRVRFFGGSGFTSTDSDGDIAAAGYEKRVPVEGDLSLDGSTPTFLVAAMKDMPEGHLDRIQIIKGWLAKDGSTEERVYDVARSGGLTDGSEPVGNTVDLTNGANTNSIGDLMFSAV